MRLTVLAAGPRCAPFVTALIHEPDVLEPTVVVGTGDELTHLGLRISPTADTVIDSLVGRAGPRGGSVEGTLAELNLTSWVDLPDSRVGVHLARSTWLARSVPPSEVLARLAHGAGVPATVRLLPATESPVETHVVLDSDDGDAPQAAVHLREWRERLGQRPEPARVVVAGLDQAAPGPGVLDSIRGADAVVLAPADPLLDLGAVLGVPGVRDALRGTGAPVAVLGPELLGPTPGLSVADLPEGPAGAARLYRDIADVWVTSEGDSDLPPSLRSVRAASADPREVARAALEALEARP